MADRHLADTAPGLAPRGTTRHHQTPRSPRIGRWRLFEYTLTSMWFGAEAVRQGQALTAHDWTAFWQCSALVAALAVIGVGMVGWDWRTGRLGGGR